MRDYLLDRQIDPLPLFAACGLPDSMRNELDPPLPITDICRLFTHTARELRRAALSAWS
ncbi:MAG: hypothetical protein R3E84_11945 [Pseudomonadales bacterium]